MVPFLNPSDPQTSNQRVTLFVRQPPGMRFAVYGRSHFRTDGYRGTVTWARYYESPDKAYKHEGVRRSANDANQKN